MGKNRKYVQNDYYFGQKNCKSYLETITEVSKSMGRKLSKFVEKSNGKLIGKEFDILRGRLGVYVSAFDYFNSAVEILSNNIVSSNNNVCNIMGGHAEVTDKYVDEIDDRIANCRSLIYSTNKKVSELEDGAKEKEKRVLAGYRASLTELLNEKKTMEELIESIAAADSAGVGTITDVLAKVNDVKSKMMY